MDAKLAPPWWSSPSSSDSRTDSICPRVYGTDHLSVYANQSASHAEFFLAEVDQSHAGKVMVISLWGPGEGGNTLQILDPSRTRSSTLRFNDRLVELTVHLPSDYASRYGTKRWWKIAYDFSSGTVTDRTTWSVQIIGNPVRLVPEE